MLCRADEINYLAGPGRGVILIKLTGDDDRVLGFIASTRRSRPADRGDQPGRRADDQYGEIRGHGPGRQRPGTAAARKIHPDHTDLREVPCTARRNQLKRSLRLKQISDKIVGGPAVPAGSLRPRRLPLTGATSLPFRSGCLRSAGMPTRQLSRTGSIPTPYRDTPQRSPSSSISTTSRSA